LNCTGTGSFETLTELEEKSPYILVVDYKDIRLVYKKSGSVFTEHNFIVKEVVKGEEELATTAAIHQGLCQA
jgi:hypothetical protein